MRALLDVRAAGIPVLVLIGGANGCFGGMGIVARCADHIVMSDVGRLAMSGPEVIEASHGVEEFDSRDRALVWRTTGGKHRWLTGDCDALVEDDVAAFRAAAIAAIGASKPFTLAALEQEHALLTQRLHALDTTDTTDRDEAELLWSALGIADAPQVGELSVDAVRALRTI
jgi:malonate decarboxylase beta subunit